MRYLAYILAGLLFVSCSVTKRRYQSGYFVQSRHAQPQVTAAGIKPEVLNKTEKTGLNNLRPESPIERVIVLPGDSNKKKCDAIVYRDGTEDSVVVTEIGVTEIKYKKCQLQNGPSFVKKRAEVFMIKFSDGSREMIVAPPPEPAPAPARKISHGNTGLGISSFILALLGIFPLTFTGSVLSILYGIIYLKDTEGTDDDERKFAWAGIIIGTIAISLFLLIFILAAL